jgi:hypothetical protein
VLIELAEPPLSSGMCGLEFKDPALRLESSGIPGELAIGGASHGLGATGGVRRRDGQ